jgi:hypothetical protein
MKHYKELSGAIIQYESKFRHSSLPELAKANLYDLYPEKGYPDPRVGYRWPEKWPHNDRAGVYVFLDENLEVLYIGKASMHNTLGARLGMYVQYDADKKCELRHSSLWKGAPRYVFVIAVPEDSRFEAASLEEYLIGQIPTSDNTNGQ